MNESAETIRASLDLFDQYRSEAESISQERHDQLNAMMQGILLVAAVAGAASLPHTIYANLATAYAMGQRDATPVPDVYKE